MNEQNQALAQAMLRLDVRVNEHDFDTAGFHAEIRLVKPEDIRTVASVLYKMTYYIGFVTAADSTPLPTALYQFSRYDINHRVMVRCSTDENKTIPTISDIFHGADWHERETRDFFGIVYSGHPNMTPLLLDESDRDLAPLLKTEKQIKTMDDLFPDKEAVNE